MLIVSGPTASGKSAFAVALADRLHAEVVSIDSMQIYRQLDVGTAKPSLQERARVPHHLLDCRDPDQPWNAFEFAQQARRCVAEINARSRIALLVGGTTLYISAILQGLAPLPAADTELRAKLDLLDNLDLHQLLASKDPVRAVALHPNDRVRVIRALESVDLLGAPVSESHASHQRSLVEPHLADEVGHSAPIHTIIVVLMPAREVLYTRINERAQGMLNAGIEREVQDVVARYGSDLPALRALGYAQVMQVRSGELRGEDLAETIARHTRRFAKRQMTFWRNEPPKRGWLQWPPQDRAEDRSKNANKKQNFEVAALSLEELATKYLDRHTQPIETTEVWYVDIV